MHAVLEQAEALPKAAEGGGRGSFQEQQVLVEGSKGPGAWQGLNGMHQVLLLPFHLVHHLQDRRTAGK